MIDSDELSREELRDLVDDGLNNIVRLNAAVRVARGAFRAILDCEERAMDLWIEHAERKAAAAIEDIEAALNGGAT